MMAFKFLRHANFETPYAYFRAELAYLHRLHVLISVCKAGDLQRIERAPSLHGVLFNLDIYFVARRIIFDRNNNFTPRVRAKGLAYVEWPEFTV